MSSGIFGRSIVLSTLFSDIFLSYLFNSISLYFTFTLSIPVIMQLPINCEHATVLAYHDVLSYIKKSTVGANLNCIVFLKKAKSAKV